MKPFAIAGLAALALLAACHREQGRGGLTADEERQLDNAAAMLDAQTINGSSEDLGANESDIVLDEPDGEANAQ